MAEKSIEQGGIIFREGDVADTACIVLSGKVELLENAGGVDSVVKVVEAGRAFAENAIFDPQAFMPYTARAAENTVLATVGVNEFKALLEECPKNIQPFLMLAFEKMKATKTRAIAPVSGVLETDVAHIIVSPGSDKLQAQFSAMDIPSARLPFRIGGYPEDGETSRRDQMHLSIAAHANPLRVSRQHCEIAVENKAVVIVDLGSRFCTFVNGAMIGRGRGTYVAPLKKGANEVILGAADGPYKLTVTCG